ncbi:hypothetical protein [Streptomyces sp. NPDC088925]|uniref:hypothetical protein n=1 Tax=Streptomyces sp. NPDC088925 TaxID=3365914 RepID=UPI00382D3E61
MEDEDFVSLFNNPAFRASVTERGCGGPEVVEVATFVGEALMVDEGAGVSMGDVLARTSRWVIETITHSAIRGVLGGEREAVEAQQAAKVLQRIAASQLSSLQ